MPAFTYLSDHEAKTWAAVPGDKDCDELLQDLRGLTGEDWVIQVRDLPVRRKGWHGFYTKWSTYRFYQLYVECHGEWQVINLVTPKGGSCFNPSGQSREDTMNFMLGYVAGIHHQRRALTEGL